MEDVAVLCFCTEPFFKGFYESVSENFLPGLTKHFYVWGNGLSADESVSLLPPSFTQNRYATLLSLKDVLLSHSYVFLLSESLYLYYEVGNEVLPTEDTPLVGVHHTFSEDWAARPSLLSAVTERNVFSAAYVDDTDLPYLFVSGDFVGGLSESFVSMAEELASTIREDDEHGIRAVRGEESHLNAFVLGHKNLFKLLDPRYAYIDGSGVSFSEPKAYVLDKSRFLSVGQRERYLDSLEERNFPSFEEDQELIFGSL